MDLILPYSDSRSWPPFGLGLHFNSDLLPQSSSWVYSDNLPDSRLNVLSEPYPIASMFIRPYMFIPGRITLPNSSPDRTSTYPIVPDHLTRLPYPILSRSDFWLPDRTRPPYPTSLPDPFPIGLLTTRSYPATLPSNAHSVKPFSTV
jgi:hypothetical protein